MNPLVVLVEPQIPANVGFTARVLANFGLEDWSLLGGCGWRDTEAERTGAPAREVLEAVREVDTLADAVAGGTHVVGFTARSGRQRTVVDLTELRATAAEWGADARPVFLFGREDRGLEKEETDACALLARIPTRGFASMNLSHAVALALYEWFRVSESPTSATGPGTGPAWSDAADRLRLAEDVVRELHASEFPDRGDEVGPALRRLAALPVETRDLRMLTRFLRHARWRREQRR